MEVKVLKEAGYIEAMLGLSLSYNQPLDKMPVVAEKLARKGGSHAKFLESMSVWLDVRAPRYWWQQFDTYRIGVTKQSESTMHTLMKRSVPVSPYDFCVAIPFGIIKSINDLIEQGRFDEAKAYLPEGFMQRRIVCMNYKSIAHIYHQRKSHRLAGWRTFLGTLLDELDFPCFISEYGRK